MKANLMKNGFLGFRLLLLGVVAVLFASCGKDAGNNGNVGTLGAQTTKTYTEQEVDQDFNSFEFAIDALYDVGIDVIFDYNSMIIGFAYYVGDRPTQRNYLEKVSADAQLILAKYGKSYFVRTASGSTYTAQLLPARVAELQLVISEAARVISELFSGAYKPQQPGQAKPKPHLASRRLDDWQQRHGNTRAFAATADVVAANDGGSDPVVGAAPKRAALIQGVAMSKGGDDSDPTTGGSPRGF